jgi:hypothetical protein
MRQTRICTETSNLSCQPAKSPSRQDPSLTQAAVDSAAPKLKFVSGGHKDAAKLVVGGKRISRLLYKAAYGAKSNSSPFVRPTHHDRAQDRTRRNGRVNPSNNMMA